VCPAREAGQPAVARDAAGEREWPGFAEAGLRTSVAFVVVLARNRLETFDVCGSRGRPAARLLAMRRRSDRTAVGTPPNRVSAEAEA